MTNKNISGWCNYTGKIDCIVFWFMDEITTICLCNCTRCGHMENTIHRCTTASGSQTQPRKSQDSKTCWCICFPNDATPNYRFLVAQKHFYYYYFLCTRCLKDRAAWKQARNSVNVFWIWLQAPKQLAARRRSMMAEPARDSLKETWGGFEILHARSG